MAASNSNKVFISYSTKFKNDFAESLSDELRKNENFDVWRDVENLRHRGGANYLKVISTAIVNTDIFICLLSNKYFDTQEAEYCICEDELSLAYVRRKNIIPILLEDITPYPPQGFELILEHRQYIKSKGKSLSEISNEVTRSINSFLAAAQKNKKKQESESTKPEASKLTNDTSIESKSTGHIFISYNWQYKDECKKINDELNRRGYKTWIDVKDMIMGSNLHEGIEKGIQNASVVLICYSSKYFESVNNRCEAEYAFNLQKNIIPIKLENGHEKGRVPGWLRLLTEGYLYVDLSGELPLDFSRNPQAFDDLSNMIDGMMNQN